MEYGRSPNAICSDITLIHGIGNTTRKSDIVWLFVAHYNWRPVYNVISSIVDIFLKSNKLHDRSSMLINSWPDTTPALHCVYTWNRYTLWWRIMQPSNHQCFMCKIFERFYCAYFGLVIATWGKNRLLWSDIYAHIFQDCFHSARVKALTCCEQIQIRSNIRVGPSCDARK